LARIPNSTVNDSKVGTILDLLLQSETNEHRIKTGKQIHHTKMGQSNTKQINM
jgi:hypothetical protein